MPKMLRFLILTCFLFCAGHHACAQAKYPYRNLVFKGGGTRGIAYVGAIRVLEERQVLLQIEKVGGTSIGSAVAAMLSVGVSADEMNQILTNMNVAFFNDGKGYFAGGIHRFRHRYGWYRGNRLEQWIGDILKQHAGSDTLTFGQLHQLVLIDNKYKDLYVTVTNLSQQRPEVFSWENRPNMQVKVAVRTSASIPMYFTAVLLDSTGTRHAQEKGKSTYDVYADGGLTANYPLAMFNTAEDNARHDINAATLGIKLDRPEQIAQDAKIAGLAPYPISSLITYIAALYNLTIEQLNPPVSKSVEQLHTVYVSHENTSPRVRKMSPAQKKLLYDKGVEGANAFFKSELGRGR